MKSVLISIQPKWCELIASGEKTVEVRKTKPKIETPFKCYIYETQGRTETPWIDEDGHEIFKGRGQVIGEFVCGRFTFLDAYYDTNGIRHLCNTAFVKSCVPDDELFDYLYGKYEKKHGGWAWHISDLVIYDKPKELSEFRTPCKMTEGSCYFCDYAVHGMDGDLIDCNTSLTRPPQSWCYVEEILPPLVEPKGKTITIPKWTYDEHKGE